MSSTKSLVTPVASELSSEPIQRDLFDGVGSLPRPPLDLGALTVSDNLSGDDAAGVAMSANLPPPRKPPRSFRRATDAEVAWWAAAGNARALKELERREKEK